MSDLTDATRELFERSLKSEVYIRLPFYEELVRRNQINFSGGKYIERLVDMDEMDDLAQAYTSNEVLTDEAKDMLDKPRFTWKKIQIPVRYPADWAIQNENADSDAQLLDLPEFLVKKAHRAARLKMMKNAFNAGSTTGRSDTQKEFQSLVSGLDHDVQYGTLARTLSTNTRNWWQGADPSGLTRGGLTSSQATATNLTISNIRKWINETDVAHYMEAKSDLYIMMCPTLFNKLRAEMESKMIYKPTGDTQRQGFSKMELDGHTVVDVPYLQESATTKLWVFIVNLNDWELRISSERNFKMTDFVWQGQNTNGVDYYLARILIAGNLCCWKPNGSIWLSNVS
jgi:hypothetical protein